MRHSVPRSAVVVEGPCIEHRGEHNKCRDATAFKARLHIVERLCEFFPTVELKDGSEHGTEDVTAWTARNDLAQHGTTAPTAECAHSH